MDIPRTPRRARLGAPLTLRASDASARTTRTSGLGEVRRALLTRLRRRGALPQDAEDAIQDAFVHLGLAEQREPIRNPAAYVTAVARRIRIAQWRLLQRRSRILSSESLDDLQIVDPSPLPEDDAHLAQWLERIWHRLGMLSPRTQEVFFRCRIEGMTCPEIGALLGISVSAVEKHLARAALVLALERETHEPRGNGQSL